MNEFEEQVLNAPGNSQEKLLRFYGKQLAPNNAKKYLAGAKLHILTMERLRNNKQEFNQPEETTYNRDNSRTIKRDIYLTEDEAASPTSIMKKCGFDPLLWEVVTCKLISGSWDVTMKLVSSELVDKQVLKTSTPSTHTNRKYSVTLTVKPLGGKLTSDQIFDIFKSLPPVKATHYEHKQGNFLLELPIMDFHLGKLSWGAETGGADYDLKIAEELWRATVMELLSKASVFGTPELILFPIGQDFYHFDTPGATTTAGTPLDSDTRWQKMFNKGISLLVWAIEQCRALAPVRIMWIPGNHDTVLSYAATVGIAQRYHSTDDVEVDLSPTPRKYIRYGRNLIGFAHGEDEHKRISGLMQIEAAEDWGKTDWREMHMGHLHTEQTIEQNGIIFRRIASITAPDAWTGNKGYIGTVRRAQAFLWDKERGLSCILNSNVRSEQ